jgi:hypothetical protein
VDPVRGTSPGRLTVDIDLTVTSDRCGLNYGDLSTTVSMNMGPDRSASE